MSRTICTEHTVEMKPSELTRRASEDLMVAMTVHGICTEHTVYMEIDNPGVYYYLVFPDSGELNALRRWVDTPTKVRKWVSEPVDRSTEQGRRQDAENLVSTWQSVSSTVLEACTKEIADEMEVPV